MWFSSATHLVVIGGAHLSVACTTEKQLTNGQWVKNKKTADRGARAISNTKDTSNATVLVPIKHQCDVAPVSHKQNPSEGVPTTSLSHQTKRRSNVMWSSCHAQAQTNKREKGPKVLKTSQNKPEPVKQIPSNT